MEANTNQEEEWKRMQVQTFTRWCNARLAVQKVTIDDLSTDLCDGVKLILLVEVLSQKRLGKFTKKPRMHAQRMENVEIVLKFITQTEKIRLVNIGSGDIVGGNLKLILGLIWTLILHYQISVGLSNTLEHSQQSAQKESGSPKENLLNYLERTMQLPGKKIRNVTTDWNDGILIATLVDSVGRGLCPECDDMAPENALQNATHAMTLAEDWLGVPQVLHPADMVNPNVDELSMMTYLSQFLSAKLKPGAPLKPTGNPSLVKVFGPGIQSEGVNVSTSSTSFTIDTQDAGSGKVYVQCIGPSGPVKVDMVSSEKSKYSCSYIPSVKGTYTIEIYFSRRPVPGSPFKIQVAGGMVTASPTRRATMSKATTADFKITGLGLNGEILLVNQPLKYLVEARGAGPGKMACTVQVSGQQVQCTPVVSEVKDGTFSIEYTPTVAGLHSMVVTFAEKPIPKSPFSLKVIDVTKIHISGAGLSGGTATKWAEFTIDSSAAGEGKCEVNISGPTTVHPTVQPGSDGVTKVKYLPAVPGKYTITILFANQAVPGSPFIATFSKPESGKAHALSGPGLKQDGIVANVMTQFFFDPKSAATVNEKFNVTIAGPVTGAVVHTQSPHAIPTVSKNANGTYNISYKPQLVGLYNIHLYLNGQELQESPIEVKVTDPTQVKLTGPGVQELTDGKPGPTIPIPEMMQWTVDCSNAGPGPLQATLQRDGGQPIDLQATNVGKGFHTIKYKPECVGQYRLCIKLAGNVIPSSPTFVLSGKELPFDIKKVTAHGAGVDKNGAQTGMVLPVVVDTRLAGPPKDVTAMLTKPSSETCTLQFNPDQKQGVYIAEYTTYETGCHTLSICVDKKPIPNSPFSIPICKPISVKLSGSGLERAIANIPNTINISTDEAGPGKVAAQFEAPTSAHCVEYTVKQLSKHTYELKYNPSLPGNYFITITYGGFPVGKKLQVQCETMENYVVEGMDGTELSKGHADTTKAKYVNLGERAEIQVTKIPGNKQMVQVEVKGPDDCKVSTKESSNNTQTVTFIPKTVGTYQVHATQGHTELKGSPFMIKAVKLSAVTLTGPGVKDSSQNSQEKHLPFTHLQWIVDYTSTGYTASDFTAIIYGEDGYKQKLDVSEKDSSHAAINFTPHNNGPYRLQVFAGGNDIPHSPVSICLQNTNSQVDISTGIVGKPVSIMYDTKESDGGSVSLEIEGPSKASPTLTSERPGSYIATFVPTKAGLYKLNFKHSDKHLPPSQMSLSVIDPASIIASGPGVTGKGLEVGKKAEVLLNTTGAGNASIAATVTKPNGQPMPLQFLPLETPGQFVGGYMPQEQGNYEIQISICGEPIPQSPFHVVVPLQNECSMVQVEDLQSTPDFIGLPQIIIDASVGEMRNLEGWVETPDAKQLQCNISKQGDKYTVSFFPVCTGLHQVHVKNNKVPIKGSPFPVEVTAQQVLSLEGPEVMQLAVGQPVKLEVSGSVERKGELRVSAEGPAECKVETKENESGTYTVELTPSAAGTYLVYVSHANHPVRGSPFVVKAFNSSGVKLSGPGVVEADGSPQQLPYAEQLEWTADLTSTGLVASDLSATAYGVEGYTQKLEVKDKDAYHATLVFAPPKCGPYSLQVAACGHAVPHSPISISLQDYTKVKASGPGLTGGHVGQPVKVSFDATQAGEGSLSLQIEGPANVSPACTSEGPGSFVVSFEPPKAGVYKLNARYSDNDIAGSPFSISVINPAAVTVSGSGVSGKGLSVGKKAEVAVDATEAGIGAVKGVLTTPSGKDIPVSLTPDEAEGQFVGDYTPQEVGNHKLHVTFSDEPIPQSPFEVFISSEEECIMIEQEELQSFNTAFGDLLEHEISLLRDSDLPHVLFDAQEQGIIEAWVETPSGENLQCTISTVSDKCKVSFHPLSTGLHYIHATVDKKPIQGTPFSLNITSQHIFDSKHHEAIHLVSAETVVLQVPEDVERVEDLDVKVEGPSACTFEIKQNLKGSYTIEITPIVAGIYLVHVTYIGHLVHGSPFVFVVVSAPEEPKPHDVNVKGTGGILDSTDRAYGGSEDGSHCEFVASGPGLEGGYMTGEVSFVVKPLNNVEGNLNVDIHGPCSCDMMKRSDGDGTAHVQYVPTLPGVYSVNITYCGQHIRGSPYCVCWSRPPPDASKCIVSGIEEQGRFHIDCKKAGGCGYLEIAVYGAFVPAEDIAVKHNGDFTFDVTYRIVQPGKTTISVKWHGVHLNGSPFVVHTI